jgi:hypothetical protein
LGGIFPGSSGSRVGEFWLEMWVSGPLASRKMEFALLINRLRFRGA